MQRLSRWLSTARPAGTSATRATKPSYATIACLVACSVVVILLVLPWHAVHGDDNGERSSTVWVHGQLQTVTGEVPVYVKADKIVAITVVKGVMYGWPTWPAYDVAAKGHVSVIKLDTGEWTRIK